MENNQKRTFNKEIRSWVRDVSRFEKVQSQIEEDCFFILTSNFSNSGEYQREKFLKVYSEGLRYLEKLLFYDKGIAQKQIIKNLEFESKYLKKYLEIEKIMLSEVKRHHLNWTIILNTKKIMEGGEIA